MHITQGLFAKYALSKSIAIDTCVRRFQYFIW